MSGPGRNPMTAAEWKRIAGITAGALAVFVGMRFFGETWPRGRGHGTRYLPNTTGFSCFLPWSHWPTIMLERFEVVLPV